MTTNRTSGTTFAIAATFVCGALAIDAHAAPFLSVDFNRDASPTETGFATQSGTIAVAGSTTHTTSEGDLTIAFASGGMFDRGAIADNGAFTFGDLYRDFYFLNGGTGTTATMTLSNAAIQPNTDYDIRLWAYDTDTDTGVNRVATFTGVTGTTGGGNLAYTQGATLTDNFQFSDVFTFTSDGTGAITIDITTTGAGVNGGSIRINGLEISTVAPPTTAPEPGSAVLAVLAIVGLALRRRHRRNA